MSDSSKATIEGQAAAALANLQALAENDPAVYSALRGEEQRERDGIELIPSENYTFPEVLAVLGSKNALSATFDSRENAGYRNINLSVIVVDSFTFSQGLDAHVCELQLGIAPMEKLRNEEGHANYIKWRDTKAE